jgi:hypothetical protein
MEGESVYIRELILPLFCFLSFSPYTVICSSYSNKYLEPLCPHLHPHLHPYPYLCHYSCPQPCFHPHPAPPLLLLLCSPAYVLWLISSLLNMDPLQLLLITVLEI